MKIKVGDIFRTEGYPLLQITRIEKRNGKIEGKVFGIYEGHHREFIIFIHVLKLYWTKLTPLEKAMK